MADRLMKGNLEARIRELRAEDLSWQEISRRLFAEASVEVSAETLRAWGRRLGIDQAA